MNGVLKFPPKWFTLFRPLSIAGGPFMDAPAAMFGVCLLETRPRRMDPDVWFPIEDFSVPELGDDLDLALKAMIGAMLEGRMVYVGCMAGRGRTGLMLSLLTKVLVPGVDPVLYVRANYFSKAVETEEQRAFVNDFDPKAIRKWTFWAALDAARGRPVIEFQTEDASDIAPAA